MTQHRIEFVTRDRTGITAVVTETGVVDVDVVIRNIESGHSGYYVAPSDWRRAPVRTLSVLGDAFLFANWEGSKRNNLHDLAFTAPIRTAPLRTAHQRSAGSRFVAVVATAVAALVGRSPSRR